MIRRLSVSVDRSIRINRGSPSMSSRSGFDESIEAATSVARATGESTDRSDPNRSSHDRRSAPGTPGASSIVSAARQSK